MPLAVGVRLGPYEIRAWLGTGGMGDVYRATDTRLGRSVAIKVLPDSVVRTPTRRARLAREARAVSRLSHPSICTLYDVGEHDGSQFIVMEYLEGETLSQRLRRGALPIADVSRAGAELADALHHAHRHGVVHRDLKPANIMLTRTGPKVLDFGLARLDSPNVDVTGTAAVVEKSAATESLTDEGLILGTVQYMAPEQLEGRRIDARTDIFALGAVLYEMATGRPAFEGSSKASMIAAILERNPPPVSLARKAATGDELDAPLLDEIVERCLAKNPDERWQSAADLSQALKWARAKPPEAVRESLPRRWADYRPGWIAWSMLMLASLTAVALMVSRERVPSAARPLRWLVTAPKGSTFDRSGYSMALSPDGTHLAFVASSEGGDNGLWVRPLDSIVPRKLADGAAQPFWSSDSRSIAFDGGGQLKKVDLATGLVKPLADTFVQSGSWNRAGLLLLGLPRGERRYNPPGLYTVSASGGQLTRATTLDPGRADQSHSSPFSA
jgi:serine/threonine protein kinase